MSARDNVRRLEMACVGNLVSRPETADAFFQQIPVDELGPGTRQIALAVLHLIDREHEVTAMSVLEELRTDGTLTVSGGGPVIYDCIAAGNEWVDAHAALESLSRIFGLRQAHQAAVRMQQAISTMTLEQWHAFASDQVELVGRIVAGQAPPELLYLEDILSDEIVPTEWAIPGILPKASATMLTASEGQGKSVLLRQSAISASIGISPFEPWRTADRYEPKRVLLVNCEGSFNQLARSIRRLWTYSYRFADEVDLRRLAIESRPAGIDLSKGPDQAWLAQVLRAHRAEVLVIGPLYRITTASLNDEEGCRTWQRPLEQLMADGLTVLTEHHAPNEQMGQRSLRPIGSSVMRRWFAQGLAIRGRPCTIHNSAWCRYCPRRASVEQWRGAREDEVAWPEYLTTPERTVWWTKDEYAEI